MERKAEIVSLAELTEIEFMRLYKELSVADAPERRKAEIIDSIWPDIYELVFKPSAEDVRYNNCKSKLAPYMVEDVEAVCKTFIKLSRRYGGVVKFISFCDLTGYSRYTIKLWHDANKTGGDIVSLSDADIDSEYNNIYIIHDGNKVVEYRGNNRYALKTNNRLSTLRFDVVKKMQEAMQASNTNGLSNDTMGHTVLANQDEDMGKLYADKQQYRTEQAKQALTEAEVAARIAARYGIEGGSGERMGIPEVPE